MEGTGAHSVVSGVAALLSVLALVSCVFTWITSRARKVRLVEDEIMSELRSYKARADKVDTRIGEWQVTVTDILNQVEDFFERTVRERKRITQQNKRAEDPDVPPVDPSTLSREDQLRLVDERFLRTGR